MAKWSKKVGFYKNFYLLNHFKNIKTQIKVANDQKPKYKSDHKNTKKKRACTLRYYFLSESSNKSSFVPNKNQNKKLTNTLYANARMKKDIFIVAQTITKLIKNFKQGINMIVIKPLPIHNKP